jgi:hypothetical protein
VRAWCVCAGSDAKTRFLVPWHPVVAATNNLTADLLLTRRVPCAWPAPALAGWYCYLGVSPLRPTPKQQEADDLLGFFFPLLVTGKGRGRQPLFCFLLCWDLLRKPQELNTARPEAKLACCKLHARNPNRFFIALLLSIEVLYPRVTIVPTIRTFFSLKRLVVVDT